MVCGAQLVLGTDGCSSAKTVTTDEHGVIWWNALPGQWTGLESYGGGCSVCTRRMDVEDPLQSDNENWNQMVKVFLWRYLPLVTCKEAAVSGRGRWMM